LSIFRHQKQNIFLEHNKNIQLQTLMVWLAGTYIFLTALLDLLDLPLVGVKIQLAELFFPLLVLFCVYHWKEVRRWKFPLIPLDFALLAYWLAFGLSCLINNKWGPWLEWLGFGYLLTVYALLSLWLANSKAKYWRGFLTAVVCMGVLSALAGIVGWVLQVFTGTENILAFQYENYPYLGDVVRADGFTAVASMLAIILEMTILLLFPFLLVKQKITRYDGLAMILMLSGLFLTLGKSILPTLTGMLWLINQRWKWIHEQVARALFAGLMIIYLGGIHAVVYAPENAPGLVGKERFLSDQIWLETEKMVIVPSTYWVLKKSNWRTGVDHFPWGVGSGEHLEYVPDLKQKGRYPVHIPAYDPHSTFLRSFSETGLFAAICLLWIIITILRGKWKPEKGTSIRDYPLYFGLSIYLIITAVEAISMDVLFFRHLWLGMALLGAIWRRKRMLPESRNPLP
jgi:hypothetical protein